jgi:outer membrane protein OmpA-like peptidoglycan-associated protein
MRLLSLAAMLAGLALPATAEACSRAFLLFFADGSTALSERSGRILAEAVWFYRNQRPPAAADGIGCGMLPPAAWRIEVEAHAWDSTPDSCGLSRLRGERVRAGLAALGIPEALVTVVPLGDRRPLVPVAPGDPEPQNRRAELFFLAAPEPSSAGRVWSWPQRSTRPAEAVCP